MKDRGMMKWTPYRSLVDQKEINQALSEELAAEEKPHISQDKAQEINEILQNYHNQKINIYFFRHKHRQKISGNLRKIDVNNHFLLIEEDKIFFNEIYNIEE